MTATDGSATGAATLTVNAASTTSPVSFTATINIPLESSDGGVYGTQYYGGTFTVAGGQDGSCGGAGDASYYATNALTGTLYGTLTAAGTHCSVQYAGSDPNLQVDVGMMLSQSSEDAGLQILVGGREYTPTGDICSTDLDVDLGVNNYENPGVVTLDPAATWTPGSQTSTWPLYWYNDASAPVGTITVN